MAADISLKHYGFTVEFQIDDHVCYLNPYEVKEDRNPENAEFIVSFIRAGITDLTRKTDLRCHLAGLRLYGTPKSSYLTCPQLAGYIREQNAAGEEFAHTKMLRGIENNVLEIDETMVATDFLSQDESPYGLALTVDDADFHYFYVDENYIDSFLEHSSTCALLYIDDWKKRQDLVRKIVLADQSDTFYLMCDGLRKNDLAQFQEYLPPNINKKIVCKKQKWKFTN